MKMRKILTLIVLLELLLVLGQVSVPAIAQLDATRDYWPTDDWRLSTPEARGMNSTILNMTSNYLDSSSISDYILIHNFMVIRNGYIVYEEYPSYYHEEMKHNTFGCTKSVTSTLIGIALENGHIDSLSDFALDFCSKARSYYLTSAKWEVLFQVLSLGLSRSNSWGSKSLSL